MTTFPATPEIELFQVTKKFGGTPVLNGVDMQVRNGEVACIIGPSGSGKSTILRCINGLVPIDSGRLRVGKFDVGALKTEASRVALRQEVSMVFQQYNLFPHRTVLENITMAPIQVLRQEKSKVMDRAYKLLEKVHMSGKGAAYPAQLSGGQQQRIAIARALAMEPKVILFDEVTAALDPEMVSEVLNVIRDLVDDGMTCVLVTHEMRFAREVADTVYFTDGGAIVEHGPPQQLFEKPREKRLKDFLGKIL